MKFLVFFEAIENKVNMRQNKSECSEGLTDQQKLVFQHVHIVVQIARN
jgi:hypothetical protein